MFLSLSLLDWIYFVLEAFIILVNLSDFLLGLLGDWMFVGVVFLSWIGDGLGFFIDFDSGNNYVMLNGNFG